jgi:hypothetical protein
MKVTGPSFSRETIIISRNRPVFTTIPVDASSRVNSSNKCRARSGSSALSKLGRRPFAIEPRECELRHREDFSAGFRHVAGSSSRIVGEDAQLANLAGGVAHRLLGSFRRHRG